VVVQPPRGPSATDASAVVALADDLKASIAWVGSISRHAPLRHSMFAESRARPLGQLRQLSRVAAKAATKMSKRYVDAVIRFPTFGSSNAAAAAPVGAALRRLLRHMEKSKSRLKPFSAAISVEPPGIEPERGLTACTISRRGGTIRRGREAGSMRSRAFKCSDAGQPGTESSQALRDEHELRTVVEPALARALALTAEAQQWDVVVSLAVELQVRRKRGGNESMASAAEKRNEW
jgi:hypothetical protein